VLKAHRTSQYPVIRGSEFLHSRGIRQFLVVCAEVREKEKKWSSEGVQGRIFKSSFNSV